MSPHPSSSRHWNPQKIQEYFLQGLFLSGGRYQPLEKALTEGLDWYTRLYNHKKIGGLPFFLVLDLGHLLLQGENFKFRIFSSLSPSHHLNMAYAEQVLNFFLSDPTFQKAHEILLKKKGKREVLCRSLEFLLEPLMTHRKICPKLLEFDSLALEKTSFSEKRDYSSFLETAEDQEISSIMEGCLKEVIARTLVLEPPFFKKTDLWELDHLEFFPSEFVRKIGRQMITFQALIDQETGEATSSLEREGDDGYLQGRGTYPEGGFSQISHRGPLENILPTELVYLGEKGMFDFSALRYLDGETLYYDREARRVPQGKREIQFVITGKEELFDQLYFPNPTSPLFKESRSYKWSVLLLGWLFSLMETLENLAPQKEYFLHFDGPTRPWESALVKVFFTPSLREKISFSWGKEEVQDIPKTTVFVGDSDSPLPQALSSYTVIYLKNYLSSSSGVISQLSRLKSKLILFLLEN